MLVPVGVMLMGADVVVGTVDTSDAVESAAPVMGAEVATLDSLVEAVDAAVVTTPVSGEEVAVELASPVVTELVCVADVTLESAPVVLAVAVSLLDDGLTSAPVVVAETVAVLEDALLSIPVLVAELVSDVADALLSTPVVSAEPVTVLEDELTPAPVVVAAELVSLLGDALLVIALLSVPVAVAELVSVSVDALDVVAVAVGVGREALPEAEVRLADVLPELVVSGANVKETPVDSGMEVEISEAAVDRVLGAEDDSPMVALLSVVAAEVAEILEPEEVVTIGMTAAVVPDEEAAGVTDNAVELAVGGVLASVVLSGSADAVWSVCVADTV